MSKYSKEEGTVGCEPDDHCCKCIPITLGVKIIAVLSILGAVGNCVMAMEALSGLVLFAFIGVAAFFRVISGLIYLKFLMSDDQENRDLLPKAVIANVIGSLFDQAGIFMA